ncbi:MAG TPA: tyrosine-type recombinase/integrase [Pirellulaceae bacterium]|nr:tyrosine-type recombinase/integrase [Pirellulaceae bacterium]
MALKNTSEQKSPFWIASTPILSASEARQLLDSIDTRSLIGLRDQALIGLMVYSFARIGAALKMKVSDVRVKDGRHWVRLREKGGRFHEMPLHHKAEQYLLTYINVAGLRNEPGTPLFRSIGRDTYLRHRPRKAPAPAVARIQPISP